MAAGIAGIISMLGVAFFFLWLGVEKLKGTNQMFALLTGFLFVYLTISTLGWHAVDKGDDGIGNIAYAALSLITKFNFLVFLLFLGVLVLTAIKSLQDAIKKQRGLET